MCVCVCVAYTNHSFYELIVKLVPATSFNEKNTQVYK